MTGRREPRSVTTRAPQSIATRVLARTPHPDPATIATALADAFLSTDDWAQHELLGAGAFVLGVRRRWLGPVVREVLDTFTRPPVDETRLLVAVILDSSAFRAAIDSALQRRSPIQVRHFVLTPSQPVAKPGLDTLADLAELLQLSGGELDWFADTKNWNRRSRPGPLQHYRYEWHRRPGRTPRLLEIPEQRLRRAQRRLLELVLGTIAADDAAHGFVPGRSAVTGAALHTGSEVVVCLDLTTFFATVTGGAVFGTLRKSGFTSEISRTITGLCTNAVPPRVLSAMPPGGSPEQRFALRKALALNHLPQGCPSSPMVANLAVRKLDSRLRGLATAVGATYTRYADDLTFSGGGALARRPDAFVRGVERIVADEGLTVNRAKMRVKRQGSRQTVTGIVVNQRLNVSRGEYDRLKATIHNCIRDGAGSQNHDGIDDFRAHLQGRVSWVASLNPARGRRLREMLALVRW